MLRFLRRRRDRAEAKPFDVPIEAEGLTYAVGDIHGRQDLLEPLLEHILQDAGEFGVRPRLVFLGDYIDRGEGARETIEFLTAVAGWSEVEAIFLMGNHEQMLLRFLAHPETARRWFGYGGLQTLMSYGIRSAVGLRSEDGARQVATELRGALGQHLPFLEALLLSHRVGNVFFAHAGADPALPIDEQEVRTLLWGCPAFHETDRRDGIWVVHGHTIVDRPVAVRGRISVDTGAYFSGRLTAARIAGGKVVFLQA